MTNILDFFAELNKIYVFSSLHRSWSIAIANAYFVLVINVPWLLVVISAFYKFYFIKSVRSLYFDLKLLIDM